MTTKSPTNYRMTNPIIVADSSPLIALAIIDQLRLLPQLYRQVLAPPTVWHEVTIQGAGLPGALAVSQVNWLDIQVPDPTSVEPLSILLDQGEAEAIALAKSISASSVLLDDAQARRVAERLKIPRIGTLGILRRAKRAGFISEIKPYIEQLQVSGIYIRSNLAAMILQDVGEL